MRQKLFTAVSVLSLLLCVATVALWVQSKMVHGPDQIMFQSCGRFWIVTSRLGQLYVESVPNWKHPPKESLAEWAYLTWMYDNRWPRGFEDYHGFCLLQGVACAELYEPFPRRFSSYYPIGISGPTIAWKAGAPHWFVLLLVSFPLLSMLKKAVAYLKVSPGHCPRCGYNLTGNTSGVCPECGAACKAADPAGVSPAAGN